jgi:hypothetical protein
MSGWCGELRKHSRCYFKHLNGIAAVRAGTYGMWDGHQWVCPCPCHEVHAFPPCPHPDHDGEHERVSVEVDYEVQQALFCSAEWARPSGGRGRRWNRSGTPAACGRRRTARGPQGASAAAAVLRGSWRCPTRTFRSARRAPGPAARSRPPASATGSRAPAQVTVQRTAVQAGKRVTRGHPPMLARQPRPRAGQGRLFP